MNHTLLYLYNITGLKKRLNNVSTIEFLMKYGYPLRNTSASLEYLSKRILNNKDFPHEIGVFLDYPLSDVEEYIINKGKNEIVTGTWKVYSNKDYALEKFNSFKQCTNICIGLYRLGYDLEQIIYKYKGEYYEEISSGLLVRNGEYRNYGECYS